MKKKFFIGILILLIAIQFIKPTKNIGNAYGENDFTQVINVPENVKNILNKACIDCHSNNTNYPWYNNIQPFGWFIKKHVNKGKKKLNLTEFKNYTPKRQAHKMDEIAEMVSNNEMPLKSYTLIHKKAKLNDEEIKLLIDWALKSKENIEIKNNLPVEENKH